MSNFDQDLGPAGKFTYGDVLIFTEDLTRTYPHKNFRPGVHFLFLEVTDSGYCFTAWDTKAQRRETFMNESWLIKYLRVTGNLGAHVPTHALTETEEN